mmetsp:Transcript_21051/g.42996  ORF Transcript_21051/g.42996 Transcript_21051/m.42996 type:complete len:165 (+) Transcript_21051:1552-2046(+)
MLALDNRQPANRTRKDNVKNHEKGGGGGGGIGTIASPCIMRFEEFEVPKNKYCQDCIHDMWFLRSGILERERSSIGTAQGTRRLLTFTTPSDKRTRRVFKMISTPVLDLLCCAFFILSTQTYIVAGKNQVVDWTFGMRKGGAQVDGEWLSRLRYAFTYDTTSHY